MVPVHCLAVTDLPGCPVEVGRVRVAFSQGRVGLTPTMTVNTATGTVPVSTPEGTAFELVRHAHACGGLDNVATVLRELVGRPSPDRLVEAASHVEMTVVQRTGYLLDLLEARALTGPLAERLGTHRSFPAALRPDLDALRERVDPWLGAHADEHRDHSVRATWRFEIETIPVRRMRLRIEANTHEHVAHRGVQPVLFRVENP